MSDLYPVVKKCHTCKEYYNIKDLIRKWTKFERGKPTEPEEYCMACWGAKND